MVNYRYLKGQIGSFLKNNMFFLFFIIFFFIVGVIFGSIAVKTLTYEQKGELLNYLSKFVNEMKQLLGRGDKLLLKDVILSNLKFILLFWFFGLTIIGIVIIPVIIFLKGFIIGFTVGFLIDEMFFKGILFVIVSIVPQNLIILPGLILGALFSFVFAFKLGKGFLFKIGYNLKQGILNYSMLMCGVGVLLIVAGLVEVYLTPNLIQLLEGYII